MATYPNWKASDVPLIEKGKSISRPGQLARFEPCVSNPTISEVTVNRYVCICVSTLFIFKLLYQSSYGV